MSTSIVVRWATDEDAPGIAGVHVAAIRGLAASHYDRSQIAAWSAGKEPARYREALAAGERLLVAEGDDGAIVGFAARRGEEVRAVYVAPAVARQGVGSRLLAALEDDARARGELGLHLDASLNAAPFYAAHGYAERSRGRHALRGGAEIECVQMSKRL